MNTQTKYVSLAFASHTNLLALPQPAPDLTVLMGKFRFGFFGRF